MKVTPHFDLAEFQTHDGEQVPASLRANLLRLCQNLEALRAHLGKPVAIVSGYRSKAYNDKINGAKASQHIPAKAADIRVEGMSCADLADTIEALIKAGVMEQGGLGTYAAWVHYDVRGRRSRWNNTATGKRG